MAVLHLSRTRLGVAMETRAVTTRRPITKVVRAVVAQVVSVVAFLPQIRVLLVALVGSATLRGRMFSTRQAAAAAREQELAVAEAVRLAVMAAAVPMRIRLRPPQARTARVLVAAVAE